MSNLKKKLKSLRHEIENIGEDIQTLNQERNDRANELIADGNELSLVFDRRIKAINKRLLAATERKDRLQLAVPLLEMKLQNENESIRDKVVAFLQNELELVENNHAQQLKDYREKQRELQVMQKQVGETYQKKRAISGSINSVLNLLTPQVISDLQSNPQYVLKRMEIKDLFVHYPELGEAISSDICKCIQEQDKTVKQGTEKAKAEKQAIIENNKSLFQQACDWYKQRKIPKELGVTIAGLTPDSLFEYWKHFKINPKTDYDSNGNFIQQRTDK